MGNTELVRIENEAVILIPYVAVSFSPLDGLFAQLWLSMEFDTNGNPVLVNNGRALSGLGRLHDADYLVADAQIGYWLIRASDDSAMLQGLAPFVELHYNGAVSNGSVLNAGSGFFIGDTGGNFDELNITTGVTARLGEQANLSVGFAAPLRNGNDRTFDYQVGVRFNWFFGYTARNMNRGTNVSTFGQ